jgi:nitrite reductase/ring-hydroxylating ferredoxin subunit
MAISTTDSIRYVDCLAINEVPPGKSKLLWVNSWPILIGNDGGQIYALYGLCGHQQLSLEGGQIWRGVVDCPWHHFQYELKTGENLYPKRVYPLQHLPHLCEQVKSLQTFPVRLVNHIIQVGLPTTETRGATIDKTAVLGC